MKADLHLHSTVSDGLLSPREVIARGARNGAHLLALTDHDDVSGLAEGRAAAQECGIGFVNGVEISVTWSDTTVHVVGLGIDPAHMALAAGLARLRSGRDARARAMAQALERCGFHGALEGARRQAANASLIGRAHFARYLVEQGAARDVRAVFDHYLVGGKPGYVPHEWATLKEAAFWIHAAGGVAVVAHPGRYRLSAVQREQLLAEFADLGGEAIEVVSPSHSASQIREFARLAARFGLLASAGSDFHGPGESASDAGGLSDLPTDVRPVWPRLI